MCRIISKHLLVITKLYYTRWILLPTVALKQLKRSWKTPLNPVRILQQLPVKWTLNLFARKSFRSCWNVNSPLMKQPWSAVKDDLCGLSVLWWSYVCCLTALLLVAVSSWFWGAAESPWTNQRPVILTTLWPRSEYGKWAVLRQIKKKKNHWVTQESRFRLCDHLANIRRHFF